MPPKLADSQILVTGAAGFIGSHLVRHLLDLGCKKIIALDDLRCGSLENLPPLGDRGIFVNLSLGSASAEQLEAACRGTDYIVHLAAEKHNQSKDNPHELLLSNVIGTQDLLVAARNCGISKFIFSSSLYAYGRMELPQTKESDHLSPSTLYGISKSVGESLVGFAAREEHFATAILRFYFVYGPNQFCGTGYKSVIVKNFERLLTGKPPLICGDGNQALDYIFVDDVINAVILALESPSSKQVFNVASSHACSINELTKIMLSVAGKNMNPEFIAADWTHGSTRVGSHDRIHRELGWSPRTSLESGLRRTFESMSGKLS